MNLKRRTLISIILPSLNEEDNVGLMHEALSQAVEGEPECDFEFLFVDDGSTDRTYERLEALHARDARVKVVRLSRNYGSHIASSVGLDFVSGDAALIIPCDLQYHPREIPRFLEQWRQGAEVVWGVRAYRQESGTGLAFSRLFAKLMRRIALPNYPDEGTGSFVLLDRKVVSALRRFPENNRMVTGLILFSGFKQTRIPYKCEARIHGISKWTIWAKLKLALDSIIAFSSAPLRIASLCGSVLALFSLFYGLWQAYYQLAYGVSVPGWSSLLVSTLFIGGVQLLVLGLLGEYLWRVLVEVRRRPLYLVWSTVGLSTASESSGATEQEEGRRA